MQGLQSLVFGGIPVLLTKWLSGRQRPGGSDCVDALWLLDGYRAADADIDRGYCRAPARIDCDFDDFDTAAVGILHGDRCGRRKITFGRDQFGDLIGSGRQHELELFVADVLARLIARQVQMRFQQFAQRRRRFDLNAVKGGGGKRCSADDCRTERYQQHGQIACIGMKAE